jgi:hypothetical protein
MNKGLEALRRRYPDKVESYYRDSDGIWLDLKPGWSRWGEVHSIHEMTTREIALALRDEVEVCKCEGCVKP